MEKLKESKNPVKEVEESSDLVVPEQLKTILADPEIPEDKKEAIIRLVVGVSVGESFSGPIPPPKILKGYNEAIENGAERVVAMAEKQSSHRIQLEDYAVREELKQSRIGQIFGFVLGLVGLLLATTLALLGHEAIAGIFGTTTIIGLVTVFVLGRKSLQKDSSGK
ncbi:MAG: DUF2335 domain-containing protein [Fibromonadales bacterium]|nr:DUF2335 domain-containing protein [Fibromonadales bacterium]